VRSEHTAQRSGRSGRIGRIGRIGTVQRPRRARPRLAIAAAVGSVALVALTACTAGSGGDPKGEPSSATTPPTSASAPATSTPPTSAAPAPDAVITAAPTAATGVNPGAPVSVAVTGGRLTSVKLVNAAGKAVSGGLTDSGSSWTSSEPLGYSKTYTLAATAVNADGRPTTKTETFTTLTPSNMTMPILQRTGGYALTNGATYGVGIVPVVHFDEPITNKAAAQRALSVTTTPHVDGTWYWADNQNVHFRPQNYWPSGTKVTVTAAVYGVEVGAGLYGQADVSASFTIGAKHITIAQDNAPAVDKVNVYFNDTLVRTMNTSMGKHSGETVNGNYISFYTMQGTYTVLEHDNPAIMSSASYGLPADAPGGYAPEKIYYSTKISTDGIYLHELNKTVWAQNSGVDVSHGCLNLNTANAVWFYNNSQIGDVVEIEHTGGPTIALWEGGDWSVPWKTWVAGSALQ
jgi:lipoprotein-anchoring transpeptidase ErfK/SrfK